jgi:hypothetical protein
MSSASSIVLSSKLDPDITLDELSDSSGVKIMSSNGAFNDANGDVANPFALDSSSASLTFFF